MIERKNLDICKRCDEFSWTSTNSGFPLYMCAQERRIQHETGDDRMFGIWHKLSTFLYPEPPKGCPYYAEHLVAVESENVSGNLEECHARLGYGRKR